MKIIKNDTVLIFSGKDKGKKGKVLKVFPKEKQLLIEGINLRKKRQKPKKQGEKGQIILMPGHVSASSVRLLCTKCGKPTRIGYKITEKKKYRVCRKCEQEI